jgi:FkbM family methyltransferase
MPLLGRAVGVASRRLGRPELLAAVSPSARQAEQEAIGISAVLASTLRNDSMYVDVGANRGQLLTDALRLAPDARHIAFEPVPNLAAELASRFPDVDCRPLALGARAEVAQFCHFTKLDGWSGLRRNAAISDERGRPEFIDVQVSTLDAEMAGVTPAVIKIDVEGAELGVLEGGQTMLSRTRPLLIIEHVSQQADAYGATADALWDLLTQLGYVIFSVTGVGPFSRSDFAEPSVVVNWLATPQIGRT